MSGSTALRRTTVLPLDRTLYRSDVPLESDVPIDPLEDRTGVDFFLGDIESLTAPQQADYFQMGPKDPTFKRYDIKQKRKDERGYQTKVMRYDISIEKNTFVVEDAFLDQYGGGRTTAMRLNELIQTCYRDAGGDASKLRQLLFVDIIDEEVVEHITTMRELICEDHPELLPREVVWHSSDQYNKPEEWQSIVSYNLFLKCTMRLIANILKDTGVQLAIWDVRYAPTKRGISWGETTEDGMKCVSMCVRLYDITGTSQAQAQEEGQLIESYPALEGPSEAYTDPSDYQVAMRDAPSGSNYQVAMRDVPSGGQLHSSQIDTGRLEGSQITSWNYSNNPVIAEMYQEYVQGGQNYDQGDEYYDQGEASYYPPAPDNSGYHQSSRRR
ncbi:hypothetical protein G7054_g5682 [Neopestalotiopsis clavispora]|nr:hypothetical protein G7054_g5682 [Neopestalotiopsis clavispora]